MKRLSNKTEMWRRHANPWSVWTRLAAVSARAVVIYGRIWLGWWTLACVAVLVLWMFLNVRIFAPRYSDERWETQAIFGEKLWLDRSKLSIPPHHLRMILILNTASTLMLVPMAYGLWVFDLWATAFGSVGIVFGQLWALDRYSWIYADLTAGLTDKERSAIIDGQLS